MAFSWIPDRRDAPELMDAPGLPEDEVAAAYRVLRRVNRQLGNLGSMRREVARMLREEGVCDRPGTLSVLDLGSGSGDIPRDLADVLNARVGGTTVVAVDRDPTAVTLARRAGLTVVRGDALRLPFADASFDLVTAVKFAHHFAGAALARLLGEMARVAGRRVIVLDIRRHWLAYYGFTLWSRVLTRNRLVRHDGPLSVLRGFTAGELAGSVAPLSDFSWVVRRYAGFQLSLVGTRVTPVPGGHWGAVS